MNILMMKSNKEKILSTYKQRISAVGNQMEANKNLNDKQVAVLLGELQVAQLELEMQNDELSMSASLLEVERAKFEGFFNLAPAGYFILDQLGTVNEVNRLGLKILGVEKRKLIGQRFQSFISPEDYELFYGFLHSLQASKIKQSEIFRLRSQTDSLIYSRIEGIALDDGFSGKLEYYITVVDITESRTAELAFKASSRRLELALSASGIGTWTIEVATGRIELGSNGLKIFGLQPWDFQGNLQSFYELIHQDDRARVRREIATALQDQQNFEFEFKTSMHKDVLVKGQQVGLENSEMQLIGIVIDITANKKAENEKRTLEREKQNLILAATFSAQEKERERISGALHDSVCQLLYGIGIHLQNARFKELAELKIVQELLEQAINQTREISYELTPSILRDFGLRAALQEMVKKMTSKGLRIFASFKSTIDRLPADLQHAAFRIIQELLNNCLKHSGASRVIISICTENQLLTIVIEDNGMGLQQSVKLAMAKGSGLRGIKNRVALLDGVFSVQSAKSGTKIKIEIKITEDGHSE